jgi:hypothetical protein
LSESLAYPSDEEGDNLLVHMILCVEEGGGGSAPCGRIDQIKSDGVKIICLSILKMFGLLVERTCTQIAFRIELM